MIFHKLIIFNILLCNNSFDFVQRLCKIYRLWAQSMIKFLRAVSYFEKKKKKSLNLLRSLHLFFFQARACPMHAHDDDKWKSLPRASDSIRLDRANQMSSAQKKRKQYQSRSTRGINRKVYSLVKLTMLSMPFEMVRKGKKQNKKEKKNPDLNFRLLSNNSSVICNIYLAMCPLFISFLYASASSSDTLTSFSPIENEPPARVLTPDYAFVPSLERCIERFFFGLSQKLTTGFDI